MSRRGSVVARCRCASLGPRNGRTVLPHTEGVPWYRRCDDPNRLDTQVDTSAVFARRSRIAFVANEVDLTRALWLIRSQGRYGTAEKSCARALQCDVPLVTGTTDTVKHLEKALSRAGIQPDELDPLLAQRMRLLASHTETVADSVQIIDLAERVFERCVSLGQPFSDVEKSTVVLGSLFSDIGKTGPAHATLPQQQLIVDMFSVERVPNGLISVEEFFRTYFPKDADARLLTFEGLGQDCQMTMRAFWNLHVGWTLELLRDRLVFREAVPAAASHHLLEHINPDSIVSEDGSYTLPFGSNAEFNRAEKLIVILDKYDASRRRSGLDHDGAMSWLRQLISKNLRFGQDEQFPQLLDVLDEVARK